MRYTLLHNYIWYISRYISLFAPLYLYNLVIDGLNLAYSVYVNTQKLCLGFVALYIIVFARNVFYTQIF